MNTKEMNSPKSSKIWPGRSKGSENSLGEAQRKNSEMVREEPKKPRNGLEGAQKRLRNGLRRSPKRLKNGRGSLQGSKRGEASQEMV